MMTTDMESRGSMNQVETVILPAIAKLRTWAAARPAEIGLPDTDSLMRAAESASRDIENLHFERTNLERDIQDIRSKLTAAHNDIANREADRSVMARRFEETQRIAAEAEQRANAFQQKADEGLRVAQEFQKMVIELQDRRLVKRFRRWIGLDTARY